MACPTIVKIVKIVKNKKGSNLMLLPTWLLCPFHHYFLNAAVQFCSVARYRFAA